LETSSAFTETVKVIGTIVAEIDLSFISMVIEMSSNCGNDMKNIGSSKSNAVQKVIAVSMLSLSASL